MMLTNACLVPLVIDRVEDQVISIPGYGYIVSGAMTRSIPAVSAVQLQTERSSTF